MKRRSWLLASTAGAGALLVGWAALPPRSRVGLGSLMQPGESDIALNGWIKILPEGGVVLAMPRSEMGQGVHTALPQLAAEELDVPLARVRIEPREALRDLASLRGRQLGAVLDPAVSYAELPAVGVHLNIPLDPCPALAAEQIRGPHRQ